MEIILDGIENNHKYEVMELINYMILDVFKSIEHNIKEIIIPDDFINIVSEKYEREYKGYKYMPIAGSITMAKVFTYNDSVEIVLNKELMSNNLFIPTLYHELCHVKYHGDIKKFDYLDFSKDDVSKYISMIFIDEYNAYKNTFRRYPYAVDMYTVYFDQLASLTADKNFKKDKMKYIDILKNLLSITLAIVDVLSLINKDDTIISEFNQAYSNTDIGEIIELLHSTVLYMENDIPSFYQFVNIKMCFERLLEF